MDAKVSHLLERTKSRHGEPFDLVLTLNAQLLIKLGYFVLKVPQPPQLGAMIMRSHHHVKSCIGNAVGCQPFLKDMEDIIFECQA